MIAKKAMMMMIVEWSGNVRKCGGYFLAAPSLDLD